MTMTSWPPSLSPTNSSVYVSNEKAVSATPAGVWEVLINAAGWPGWYGPIRNVRLEDGDVNLNPGTRFRWSISRQPLSSQVRVFEPTAQLAWESRNPLIRTFHVWHLLPTATGCTVMSEECQRGPFP